MSRRQDREGIPRHEMQLRQNEKWLAAQRIAGTDERGWNKPCTVWDRWRDIGSARAGLRRLLILRRLTSDWHRKNTLRAARFDLARARAAPKPRLP